MRLCLFILFAFFGFAFDFTGSSTAYLTCKSESGRTVFNASLQDITGLLESAELSVDGKKLQFNDEDEVYTIFDAQKAVFTIYITGKATEDFPNGRFVQFWALPESFTIIKSATDHQIYEFNARIEATEPRKGRNLRIPLIELKCKLEYKI